MDGAGDGCRKRSDVRRRGKVQRFGLFDELFDENTGFAGARRRFDEEYTSTTIEEGYEVITEANQAEATTRVCWVRGQSSQSVEKPGFNGAGL